MDNTSSTSIAFQERIDLRQDTRYRKFVESIGFESIKIKTSIGFAYGYIKYLPVLGIGFLKIQRYKGAIDQEQLVGKIRVRNIWRTILEPINDPLVVNIARQNRDPFLPTKTRVLNLFENPHYSLNVMRIGRKMDNLVFGEVDVNDFFVAWKQNSKIWTLSHSALVELKKNFGRDCVLWVEKDGDEIVGGIVCLIVGEWAYYFAAFVSSNGRKHNSGVLGVLSLINELKSRRVKYLDFEGIYDARFPRDSWRGFSEFKSRFGGTTIELPGCFGRWF